MILADTSVWIDHLRAEEPEMRNLLRRGGIVMHRYVLGELFMVNFRERDLRLRELFRIKQCAVADAGTVFALVEGNRLFGRGIGFVDAHLLAACRMAPPLTLWTTDRRLAAAAAELGVSAAID